MGCSRDPVRRRCRRRSVRLVVLVSLWALLATLPAAVRPAAAQDGAWALMQRIAAGGPRVSGSSPIEQARGVLLDAMATAGLEEMTVIPIVGVSPDLVNLTATAPGRGPREILITAHYDTVAGSPGAVDNASGCAVAILAAARLQRADLQSTVRVVLLDGEEMGLAGSRAFAADLPVAVENVAAIVNLDMVGRRDARRAVAHVLPPPHDGRLGPPAWLVDAALRTSRRLRFPLEVGDATMPVPGQLLERYGRLRFSSDSEPFLAAGLPAMLLSDASLSKIGKVHHTPEDRPREVDPQRLEDWLDFVVALAEEADRATATGIPAASRDYLVVAGTVWTPTSIRILAGLLILGIGWRLARHGGRAQGPAIAFLAVTAVAWWLAPLGSFFLLLPAMLIALIAPRPSGRGLPALLAGLLPAAVLLGLAAFAFSMGLLVGLRPEAWRLLLPLAAAAVYALWRTDVLRRARGHQAVRLGQMEVPVTPPPRRARRPDIANPR